MRRGGFRAGTPTLCHPPPCPTSWGSPGCPQLWGPQGLEDWGGGRGQGNPTVGGPRGWRVPTGVLRVPVLAWGSLGGSQSVGLPRFGGPSVGLWGVSGGPQILGSLGRPHGTPMRVWWSQGQSIEVPGRGPWGSPSLGVPAMMVPRGPQVRRSLRGSHGAPWVWGSRCRSPGLPALVPGVP